MSSNPDIQALIDSKNLKRTSLIDSELGQFKNLSANPTEDVTGLYQSLGLLASKEIEIVSSSPDLILGKLKNGEWKATEVVGAFCKSAAIAGKTTNCLTEIMFEEAKKRAQELDDHFVQTGKPVGILHGLPISLKDSVQVKGFETTIGYPAWLGRISNKNSLMVDLLLEMGAVIYCKTNIPQTLMTAESSNNVFGPTCNPFNLSLTAGGSTGGEGALIAMKGSVIGLGTDIAGSVRIPAAACGIWSLKPSCGRIVSSMGVLSTVAGQESVPATFGPMASTPEGLEILMSALSSSKTWLYDSKVIPMPWNPSILEEIEALPVDKLTFGVLRNDGIMKPHKPVSDALDFVVAKLRAKGHEVIEYPEFDYKPVLDISLDAFTADGCKLYQKAFSEGSEGLVGPILLTYERLLGKVDCEMTVGDLWKLHARRTRYTNDQLALWQSTAKLTKSGKPIDGLITPAGAHSAPPHENWSYLGYTGVWNVFDFSAGVFPLDGHKVDKTYIDGFDKQRHLESYKPLSDIDQRNWELYDPTAFSNGPLALQMVTRRLEEEKCIALMKVVSRCLKP